MSKRQLLIQTLLGSYSLKRNPSAALSKAAAALKTELKTPPTRQTKIAA